MIAHSVRATLLRFRGDRFRPLRSTYPSLVGRFERLFERCGAIGIGRPTVLVPWAASLYARFPQVEGVALWDQGNMGPIISRLTAGRRAEP
jgi:hypothetical protein